MIGYIVLLIIFAMIVSTINELLVIKRLQMSEGVKYTGGKCKLLEGYGKLKLD